MRARISRCIDWSKPEHEQLCWGILVQEKKGTRFNIPVSQGKALYSTLNKNEAINKVRKMNKEFRKRESNLLAPDS